MRRALLLLVFVTLAFAPAAEARELARYVSGNTESLSLADGRGMAVLRSRAGAVLGSVERGRVTVVDLRRGPRTKVRLFGCETRIRIAPRTQICRGRALRFSVLGGRWRLALRGAGIDASAVLRGSVMLRGTDGTYSIAGSRKRPWPRVARTFVLGG